MFLVNSKLTEVNGRRPNDAEFSAMPSRQQVYSTSANDIAIIIARTQPGALLTEVVPTQKVENPAIEAPNVDVAPKTKNTSKAASNVISITAQHEAQTIAEQEQRLADARQATSDAHIETLLEGLGYEPAA